MLGDGRHRQPLPDTFSSPEEAVAFWDEHDTTDYPEAFSEVDVMVALRGVRHEIDIATVHLAGLCLNSEEADTQVPRK